MGRIAAAARGVWEGCDRPIPALIASGAGALAARGRNPKAPLTYVRGSADSACYGAATVQEAVFTTGRWTGRSGIRRKQERLPVFKLLVAHALRLNLQRCARLFRIDGVVGKHVVVAGGRGPRPGAPPPRPRPPTCHGFFGP